MPTIFGRTYGYSAHTRPTLVVLASRGISQELKDAVRTAHSDELSFCRSELATADWSPNWLGYTVYDVVLITAQEAAEAPPEVLLALRRYVEVGGIVLVQGDPPNSSELIPAVLREGGHAALDGTPAFLVGFGLVGRCPTASSWPREYWAPTAKSEIAPTDDKIQAVTQVTVPVRGLLAVVIAFSIGIGPVNVWLLSRRKTADVALVGRAGDFGGDLPGRFRLFAVVRGDHRPGTLGRDHLARREHAPGHDAWAMSRTIVR